MEIREAMRECEPGGYMARKAYPGRKYYKDESGLFENVQKIDYIDFIAKDWEYFSGDNRDLPQHPCKRGWEENSREKQAGGF
jgi:hypothetical protein